MSLDAEAWSCVDHVLTKCEGVHVPTDFCVTAAVVLRQVYPYDAATVFFLGEDGRLANVRLLGVSRALAREYVGHYMNADDGAYSIERAARDQALREARQHGDPYRPVVLDWEREPHDTQFWREYASRLRLRWSAAACLYDLQGRVRVVIEFDRGERGHAPRTRSSRRSRSATTTSTRCTRTSTLSRPASRASRWRTWSRVRARRPTPACGARAARPRTTPRA